MISARSMAAVVALVPISWLPVFSAPAGAAAPPPVVSATSGGPGTRVEVRADDVCPPSEGAGTYQRLVARLVSGTGASTVLAAADEGRADHVATLVVPDWVDPAQPAQIETECVRLSPPGPGAVVQATYDPVPFDVLPGAGAATQLVSLDRTVARVGETIGVAGQDCTAGDADRSGAYVFSGGDRTGRTFGLPALSAAAFVAGPALGVNLVLLDADASLGGGIATELANQFEPGTYTVVAFCAAADGTATLYEPQIIQVTGTAPIHDVDLTADPGSRRVTVSGGSCPGDFVDLYWYAVPAADAHGSVAGVADLAPLFETAPALPVARPGPNAAARPRVQGAAAGALPDNEIVTADIGPVPADDGSWSASAEVGFDEGFVVAFSSCPAPDGGFAYEVQAVAIHATPPTTTPPASASPTSPAAAAPATARPGQPAYTG